ncbi:unnamed protein product [Urochloa humidicola]
MQKQEHPISGALPPSNKDSKKPSMASQQGATGRSGGADDDARSHTDPEDFEFCILSSGGLALAGDDAADMCVADEVFSGGMLLPFRRLSSATSADAPALMLLRSDSTAAASTSSSRSVSRSASSGSNSSSSSSVSRSTSSKSASSDPASVATCPPGKVATAAVPPRRSLSGNVFYAHPSPSPRISRRSGVRVHAAAGGAAAGARRSTGSAPPASWGLIRLGVVGAPEVYAPRPAAEYKKATGAATAARGGGGGSRSARFDQPSRGPAAREEKKLALGILSAGLVCSCSPDAVAPLGFAEVAAAEARRRRKKKAEEKKRAAKQSGQSTATARRSRILEWLEDLSISKEKSVV